MKIFISADIEGVTGVTTWASTRYGGKDYEQACEQMTREVAAVSKAALDAGCEVVVKDGHEDAMNIDPFMLPKGTQLLRGWMNTPLSMMAGLDETFDGIFYIGYHSGAWTNTSPLKHTGEDYLYNWVKVNGVYASEFTLNHMVSDQLGVPSLLLSGDRGICSDAAEQYPGIVTVETKDGIGNGTWNRHPADVLEELERKVSEIVSKPLPKAKALEESYTMELCFKDHQRARHASWYPGVKRIDDFTVEYTADTPVDLAVARMFMVE